MDIILTPLSQVLFFITGVEVQADQLIFLSTLFVSLIGSFAYKHFLQPSSVPLEVQLLLTSLFGIWIFYLNWGWYIWVPLFDVVGSYLIVRWFSPLVSHKYVFMFTMSVLSACHLHTLYLFMYGVAGDTSADYTSPMMVITQRLTSLSFSIADGFTRNPDSLSDNQKEHAVRKIPSFIEYFSYSFCFLGIMAGPLVFYNYFMECMKSGKEQKQAPSALVPVVMKWLVGVGFISCYVVGGRYFPALRNADPSYTATTAIWQRLMFIHISMFISRSKYYGVWMLCDSINNAAGIGFNGRDGRGNPLWNKVSNINIPNIEFATGMKTYIDNWNINTVKWIRLVAYERLGAKQRTLASFMLSAFWHGFLPGYYIMFLTAHIFLLVQRKVRKLVRPRFQTTPTLRMFYEVTTWAATQAAIGYSVVPFVLLEWHASYLFYRSLWFAGHIIGIALLLLVSANIQNQTPNQSKHSNGNNQHIHQD